MMEDQIDKKLGHSIEAMCVEYWGYIAESKRTLNLVPY